MADRPVARAATHTIHGAVSAATSNSAETADNTEMIRSDRMAPRLRSDSLPQPIRPTTPTEPTNATTYPATEAEYPRDSSAYRGRYVKIAVPANPSRNP